MPDSLWSAIIILGEISQIVQLNIIIIFGLLDSVYI
jgi:hypothetical protein